MAPAAKKEVNPTLASKGVKAAPVPKKKAAPKLKVAAPKVNLKEGELGKLRIRISAYENKVLDASVKQIIDTASRYEAQVRGPVPLPTGIKRYTVNRASFIDKNSREQFEMRIHKRLIDILNPNPKIVESLTNLSLPSGVHIDVKMM